MSTKIKGGGRAILSKESQQSLIDLLFSLETAHDDNDGRTSSSLSEASNHDRKQLQKKFVKRLVRRHERRVLRQQFNADGRGERAAKDDKTDRSRDVSAGLSDMSSLSTAASGGNVRIELAEAIFTTTKDKSSSKKKSSKKDSKKDKDKSNKTKKKKDNNEKDLFKIGTKKVVVLPRSTSIANLLKQSKSKLKLKKNPVRAFVQTASGGGDALFDLEHDLSGVVDGTVVYVTLTPKANTDEKESTKDEDDNEEDNDTDDNTDALLDSIKLAYKQQQSHRNSLHQSRQQQLQRVDEVIDTKQQQIQLESRQRLPAAWKKLEAASSS